MLGTEDLHACMQVQHAVHAVAMHLALLSGLWVGMQRTANTALLRCLMPSMHGAAGGAALWAARERGRHLPHRGPCACGQGLQGTGPAVAGAVWGRDRPRPGCSVAACRHCSPCSIAGHSGCGCSFPIVALRRQFLLLGSCIWRHVGHCACITQRPSRRMLPLIASVMVSSDFCRCALQEVACNRPWRT